MSRKIEYHFCRQIAFLTLLSAENGSKGFSQISDPKIHNLSLQKLMRIYNCQIKYHPQNFQISIFKITILQSGALGTHLDAKHLSWNSCH